MNLKVSLTLNVHSQTFSVNYIHSSGLDIGLICLHKFQDRNRLNIKFIVWDINKTCITNVITLSLYHLVRATVKVRQPWLGVMMYACNSRIWKLKVGGSQVQSHLGYAGNWRLIPGWHKSLFLSKQASKQTKHSRI